MPLDILTNPDSIRIAGPISIVNDPQGLTGKITLDNGLASSDGSGNMTVVGLVAQTLYPVMGIAAPVAIATGNTIVIPAGTSVVRLSAAAACTGVIMPVGTKNGQTCILINTSAAANTITFAAAGTSFVAGGVATSIAGLASHMFVWDNVSLLWYQVGPLAN